MYPLQSTTIEAGFAVAEPLDDQRLRPRANSLCGCHDATPLAASVRHVLRAIASDPGEALDRKRWLARVRPLVDRSQATLRARFEADGSVEAFLRGRTRLADGAVIGLLHLARAVARADDVVTAIAPVTVMALGGYGRRELGPASDLDLLFLLADRARRSDAERLIGFVLTGLWDLGFVVGHATRTVAECIELSRVDHKVLASLLDARFLAGSVSLHAMLESAILGKQRRRLERQPWPPLWRQRFWHQRGPTPKDEEEPDVKRGPGALRDVQRVLWLARLGHLGAASGARSELAGWDAPVPAVVADARRFLWQVRCHLHLLAGRAQDQLVRELQPLVARRLGLGHGPNAGVAELMERHHAYTRAVRALLTAP